MENALTKMYGKWLDQNIWKVRALIPRNSFKISLNVFRHVYISIGGGMEMEILNVSVDFKRLEKAKKVYSKASQSLTCRPCVECAKLNIIHFVRFLSFTHKLCRS